MSGITKDHQKHIEAEIGVPFPIRLWEDRSRGEIWAPIYGDQHFNLIDDEYEETSTYNAGMRVMVFDPLEEGQFEIIFEKRLGWKFTAEIRKRFLVTVRPSK